jgi:hypothetical protein
MDESGEQNSWMSWAIIMSYREIANTEIGVPG